MDRKSQRFEALVQAFAADLYRYAHWLDEDLPIEGLLQETFTRAWRTIDTLRDEHSARRWLFATLRQLASRHLPLEPQIDPDPPSKGAGGFDQASTAALRRAFRQLPLAYRDPLLLQILGGFSTADIALLLHLTPSATTSRLARGRRCLRDLLKVLPAARSRGRSS